MTVRKAVHTALTHIGTFTAENTLIGAEKKLRSPLMRFRVMTPCTGKRTALEKYRGPYSGAVIYTEFLYIKNISL